MDVIFIAPGYPAEMPHFVRGFATQGARVWGVGDVPAPQLPALAQHHLAGYFQVPSLQDEEDVVRRIAAWMAEKRVARVICMWEPGVVLAAKLRAALKVPGQTVESAVRFRDKDLMKQQIAAAGIRTARHARAATVQEVRDAAEYVGYPAIVKPIAGAGSMDTFKVHDAKELEQVLDRLGHVPEVNVEEFITGEEFTFDTICIDGEIRYFNIGYYRPNPLIARSNEWISPQTLCLRDVDHPSLATGRALGRAVLDAMEFRTGFTHMEWFRTASGEAIFGEIAARPPGAHTVDLMNFASDIDLFEAYAEAELHGTFSTVVERKYNTANIFKRASGQGRIVRIEGLERLLERFGAHVCHIDLLPIGAPRRDWILTLVSDGYVVVRHPDWETTKLIADAFGTDLRLVAR